jgi:hypothetical protein
VRRDRLAHGVSGARDLAAIDNAGSLAEAGFSKAIAKKRVRAQRYRPEGVAMRLIAISFLSLVLSAATLSADDNSAVGKIRKILVTQKNWTMYLEYTGATAPSERANVFKWEYFERDGKLFGRRVGMAFGGCEVELSVRSDGFSFPWCDKQLSGADPSLSYDPSDPQYPFKNMEPRKFWLKASE